MITSAQNPKVQRVRGLLEKRKTREQEQAFVIEGVRLAEEALASGWQADLVLHSNQLGERGQMLLGGFASTGAEVVEIPPKLMESITGTETPQGIMVVLPLPDQNMLPLPDPLNFVVIADNLRDPGNLGTLLRTAGAAGAQAVLLSPGTADAFSPKVLRAGMGAHFRLPALHSGWGEIRAICKNRQPRLQVILADAAAEMACWDVDLRQPLALIVSSEAEGPSTEARALATQAVTIPMPGQSESLNAAIAASILLFEVVRQRRDLTPADEG
jgi:RNA methyltransferase, TrmH family